MNLGEALPANMGVSHKTAAKFKSVVSWDKNLCQKSLKSGDNNKKGSCDFGSSANECFSRINCQKGLIQHLDVRKLAELLVGRGSEAKCQKSIFFLWFHLEVFNLIGGRHLDVKN